MKDNRSDKFIKELQQLLTKYNAEIRSSDEWTGYAECGQDIRIFIEFNELDNAYQQEIDLGQWIDKDTYANKTTEMVK